MVETGILIHGPRPDAIVFLAMIAYSSLKGSDGDQDPNLDKERTRMNPDLRRRTDAVVYRLSQLKDSL
jgi:hypothetical protein